MPYRRDVFTLGRYYHIYNRGAGKGRIFFNEGNYRYLLGLAERYYQRHGATIIAYCLMPNHYHFLIRQETELPLSKFINVTFNAYVQALNLQQGRTGTLFEGRFRHRCVETWQYLAALCRYIHLNPVKAGLVARPEDWTYSNYREWMGLRNSGLVDKTFVQDHFPNVKEYDAFVNDAEGEKNSYGKIRQYVWD